MTSINNNPTIGYCKAPQWLQEKLGSSVGLPPFTPTDKPQTGSTKPESKEQMTLTITESRPLTPEEMKNAAGNGGVRITFPNPTIDKSVINPSMNLDAYNCPQ